IKQHLEPFAFMANVTQSDGAHLDVVLITLGNLFHIFLNSSIDSIVRGGVIKSLEKQWKKADQDYFILALVLNPFIQCKCFHPNSPFRIIGGLWPVFKKSFRRFFDKDPDFACHTSLSEYISDIGRWSYKSMCLDDYQKSTPCENVSFNFYTREHDTGKDNGRNGLVRMALHILNVIPNSAAMVRTFGSLALMNVKSCSQM
ncbi:hypothetical protein BDQ17DRAFT_1214890, partial [Cyathus striatus]